MVCQNDGKSRTLKGSCKDNGKTGKKKKKKGKKKGSYKVKPGFPMIQQDVFFGKKYCLKTMMKATEPMTMLN